MPTIKREDGPRRLYRSQTNQVIAGVASGLGEYFNLDPVIFRILFILTSLTPPFLGLVAYIVLAIILPTNNHSERTQKKPQDVASDLRQNAESLVDELKEKDWQNLSSRDVLGLVIVGIGILILLGQLFSNSWGVIWPIVIILAGIYFIARRR